MTNGDHEPTWAKKWPRLQQRVRKAVARCTFMQLTKLYTGIAGMKKHTGLVPEPATMTAIDRRTAEVLSKFDSRGIGACRLSLVAADCAVLSFCVALVRGGWDHCKFSAFTRGRRV